MTRIGYLIGATSIYPPHSYPPMRGYIKRWKERHGC